MSRYAFEFLAKQMTEMLDYRFNADFEQMSEGRYDYKEAAGAFNLGSDFSFGEQLFQLLCLDYLKDGQPSIGLLSICQAMMKVANDNTNRYTVWVDKASRFPEGENSLHRIVDFTWVRYFSIAEGILQLEMFNSNIRRVEDPEASEQTIRGAQVVLGMCVECATVMPMLRSRPSGFCCNKCRISSHTRGAFRELMKEGKDDKREPKVEPVDILRQLSKVLIENLKWHIEQGITYSSYGNKGVHWPGFPEYKSYNRYHVEKLPMKVATWRHTFQVSMAGDPLPMYEVEHKGLENSQIAELEMSLASCYEKGNWFSPEADTLRGFLRSLDPNHPMLENKAEEAPKRTKYLANPSRWLVKWRKDGDRQISIQRMEPDALNEVETLHYWDLVTPLRKRLGVESRRYQAADFPTVNTEPGSLEETVEQIKSGTIDVSKTFKMSPGWKRNDPQKPQPKDKA